MTKKKVTTITKPVIEETKPEIAPIDVLPPTEVPERQIEDVSNTTPIEQPVEAQTEPEPTSATESTKVETHTESPTPKSEPEPIVETLATKSEVVPVVEVPAPKPKPLTMVNLQSELEELRKLVLQQSQMITELKSTPVKTRNPPVSVYCIIK